MSHAAPARAGRGRHRRPSCATLDASPDQVMETRLAPAVPASRQRGLRARPGHRAARRFRHVDLVRLPHPAHPGGDGVAHRARHQPGHRGRGRAHPGRPPGLRELPERAVRGPRPRRHPRAAARADAQEKALYDSLLKNVVSVGGRAFAGRGRGRSVYLGRHLEHPRPAASSRTLDRMRALFKTFEEKSRLVKILNACLVRATACASSSATRTRTPSCARLALVTASYPGGRRGGLGPGRRGQHAHGVRAA